MWGDGTDAFKAAGHTYRKLKPFAGDTSDADMAEGEGAIGSEAGDKKNKNDFALWKCSKPGEVTSPLCLKFASMFFL